MVLRKRRMQEIHKHLLKNFLKGAVFKTCFLKCQQTNYCKSKAAQNFTFRERSIAMNSYLRGWFKRALLLKDREEF